MLPPGGKYSWKSLAFGENPMPSLAESYPLFSINKKPATTRTFGWKRKLQKHSSTRNEVDFSGLLVGRRFFR
jgi:hypothetical protein